jgi:hypothetical protein
VVTNAMPITVRQKIGSDIWIPVMKTFLLITILIVLTSILNGGCATSGSHEMGKMNQDMKQQEVERFSSENDWLVLSATVAKSYGLSNGISCDVRLENKSDRMIQHVLVDPWYDLKPRLMDQAGTSPPMTDIGRVRLQERRQEFRRRRVHNLLPGESYNWELDLGSTYELQPGTYVLEISVRFRVVEEGEVWQLPIEGLQPLSLSEIPVRIVR